MDGFREEAQPFAEGADCRPPLKSTTVIGRDGRIVIPAAMRKVMGAADGSNLILVMQGETLEVFTVEAGIRRAQAIVRSFVPRGVSLSEELIADRRREADEEAND